MKVDQVIVIGKADSSLLMNSVRVSTISFLEGVAIADSYLLTLMIFQQGLLRQSYLVGTPLYKQTISD